MKKLLMILAVLVLSFTLVACDNNTNNDVNNDVNQGEENVLPGEDVNQGEDVTVEDPGLEDMPVVSTEMETLVNDLVATVGEENMFMGMMMPIVKEGAVSDLGLTEEQFETMIEDSVKFDPPMIPANHSLCIVKVKEGEDVAAVKQAIFDNADYRKWICAAAEKVLVADSGNYVMLVMSTPEVCSNLYSALQTKFGAENVGAALERDGEPAPNYEEAM